MVAAIAKRDELFQMFGPKLTEAFMMMVLDEINILRAEANLPARTELQFYNKITNHLSELPDYDWMNGD